MRSLVIASFGLGTCVKGAKPLAAKHKAYNVTRKSLIIVRSGFVCFHNESKSGTGFRLLQVTEVQHKPERIKLAHRNRSTDESTQSWRQRHQRDRFHRAVIFERSVLFETAMETLADCLLEESSRERAGAPIGLPFTALMCNHTALLYQGNTLRLSLYYMRRGFSSEGSTHTSASSVKHVSCAVERMSVIKTQH